MPVSEVYFILLKLHKDALHINLSQTFPIFLSCFLLPLLTARLTISVLDVNDNAPRFRPFGVTNFSESILEGAQPGTTLLSVSAVDPDKGPNGQIFYQLLNLPRGGYVTLEDPSTGENTSIHSLQFD